MEHLSKLLISGGHSLVVRSGSAISTYDGRGVADLHRLLHESRATLHDADVADKVVGKAAAALMIEGGVSRLHALTISRPALDLLHGSGVETTYDELVDHIVNRAGNGWCPMELRCRDCRTTEECLAQIDDFLNSIKQNNNPTKQNKQ